MVVIESGGVTMRPDCRMLRKGSESTGGDSLSSWANGRDTQIDVRPKDRLIDERKA